MKVFVDANVFFTAIYNPDGGSGFILNLYKKKEPFELITVTHAISEASKNILLKLGDTKLDKFYKFIVSARPQIKSLMLLPSEVDYYLKFVPLKDVPILAGADKFQVDFLLTLDRKHFLNKKEILERHFPFKVVNPHEFLKEFRDF